MARSITVRITAATGMDTDLGMGGIMDGIGAAVIGAAVIGAAVIGTAAAGIRFGRPTRSDTVLDLTAGAAAALQGMLARNEDLL